MSRADLVELTSERARLMMAPCKNMQHLGGKTCPLVLGAGGELIDPVAELHNLLRVDPLAPGLRAADVPLFRSGGGSEPLRSSQMLHLVRRIVAVCGEDPTHFGTHSLRIGGATSLFAAGADMTVVRTMGRWSSDVYQLYVRACFERCCDWTRRAGSTPFTDVEGCIDEVDYY